jgi:signal peptidase I
MREPPDLHHKDAEILLSGNAVIALLSAVHEKGADFRFRASGGSMYPVIRNGDVITLSPLRGIHPGHGIVLAFLHPEKGKLVVHRVIGVSPDAFWMKGDNTPDPDGLIPTSNILGVVTRVERDGSPLFWPDIRHFPRAARVYFNLQNGFVNLKKKIHNVIREAGVP